MLILKRERENEKGPLQWHQDGHKFFDTLPMKRCGLCSLPLNVGRLYNYFDQLNKVKMALCQFPSQVLTRLASTAYPGTLILGTQLPGWGRA